MLRFILIFAVVILVFGGSVGFEYAGKYALLLEASIVTAIFVLVAFLVLDWRSKFSIE